MTQWNYLQAVAAVAFFEFNECLSLRCDFFFGGGVGHLATETQRGQTALHTARKQTWHISPPSVTVFAVKTLSYDAQCKRRPDHLFTHKHVDRKTLMIHLQPLLIFVAVYKTLTHRAFKYSFSHSSTHGMRPQIERQLKPFYFPEGQNTTAPLLRYTRHIFSPLVTLQIFTKGRKLKVK